MSNSSSYDGEKNQIKEQKKCFANTSDVVITKNGASEALTIRKGKRPITNNKKQKNNQREKL